MDRKERLIAVIFKLLEIIETRRNHSEISQIRGLLNELRNM